MFKNNFLMLLSISVHFAAPETGQIEINNKTEYVVIILSKVGNTKYRLASRITWFNLAQNVHKENGVVVYKWNKTTIGNTKQELIKIFFIIGTKKLSKYKLRKINAESKKNKDLLLLDRVEDNYDNLSLKVLEAMKWCSERFINLRYIIKTDDDSFVRIDRIVKDLDDYAPDMNSDALKRYVSCSVTENTAAVKGLYWGYFHAQGSIHKCGKNREMHWFLSDYYLPYAIGGGYVISKTVVDFIVRNYHILLPYRNEDVSIGVFTTPLDINRVHDIRFDTTGLSIGCKNYLLITTIHDYPVKQMFVYYINLIKSKGERMCVLEKTQRAPYYFNWTVLPSECCKSSFQNV